MPRRPTASPAPAAAAAAPSPGPPGPAGAAPRRSVPVEPPDGRRLRVYAFDPSLSTRMDTALINHATLTVPWEDDLRPGPVGEYVEVVDVDPASNCAYLPVDLNDAYLLASDGLDPAEGNPQFHQQMVYAVTMNTIRNFEKALGRPALWAPRYLPGEGAGEEYVRRLRIYPHGIREANAYYSTEKKALVMGYFPSSDRSSGEHYPGGLVFTCLSQDIVAHETAHALLDGMHRHFVEATNEDTYALHEGFADIVALFQRFALPEVLRHQIAKTRGDLEKQHHLLGAIAQEFGRALGGHGALRTAIGQFNPETGEWEPKPADPEELSRTREPHARGALLVAAVFDAFLAIYKSRIADLIRIATGGTGILPAGEISSELVNRLADEAAKSARHVLEMCIRAMDYLPPVDVNFGDYLRALITADYDLVPSDPRQYRLAFLAAFRGRGIYPDDIRSLSVNTLRWRSPEEMGESAEGLSFGGKLKSQLQMFANEWRLTGRSYEAQRSSEHAVSTLYASDPGMAASSGQEEFNLSRTYREAVFLKSRKMRRQLERWLKEVPPHERNVLLGLKEMPGADGSETFGVRAIRPVRRVGPDDQTVQHMIIEITQEEPAWIQSRAGRAKAAAPEREPDFYFRGGATIIVELETGAIRYIIRKRIDDPARRARNRDYASGRLQLRAGLEPDATEALRLTYGGPGAGTREPFALLHRSAPRDDSPTHPARGAGR